MIAQVNSDGKTTYAPADFMPSLREQGPDREMSLDESIHTIAMLNAAFGGTDRREAA